MSSLNESIVEDAALTWFGELGYARAHGPAMAPGEPAAEREGFGDVVLAALMLLILIFRPNGITGGREVLGKLAGSGGQK